MVKFDCTWPICLRTDTDTVLPFTMWYIVTVLTATSTSTVLPTTARTSTATTESTASTSAKTSGMVFEAVVFTALHENSIKLYDAFSHSVAARGGGGARWCGRTGRPPAGEAL